MDKSSTSSRSPGDVEGEPVTKKSKLVHNPSFTTNETELLAVRTQNNSLCDADDVQDATDPDSSQPSKTSKNTDVTDPDSSQPSKTSKNTVPFRPVWSGLRNLQNGLQNNVIQEVGMVMFCPPPPPPPPPTRTFDQLLESVIPDDRPLQNKNNLDLNGVRERPLGTDYFCTVPNKSRMIFPLVKVKSSKLVSRAECSICQNVMTSTNCVPALLKCGHVATCVLCYENWNKDKHLKTCPICKATQVGSPIQVGLEKLGGYTPSCGMIAETVVMRVKKNPRQFLVEFKIRVNYVAGFTRTGLTKNGISLCYTPPILCKMSASGDDIKKTVLPYFSDINFPNDHLLLFFATQNHLFPFHGNTTLNDIGFTPTTHSIKLLEGRLPFEHYLIQQRLELLPIIKYSDSFFKIRIKPSYGLKLTNCSGCIVRVAKHNTMGYVADRIVHCLTKAKYVSHIGKKLTLNLIELCVVVERSMTLEKLKVNANTIIYFNLID